MKRISIIVASIIFLSVTSCDKKETTTDPAPSKTKTEYMTTGTWKQVGVTVSPGIVVGGTTITDLWPLMPACEKDDFRKFNANGSGTTDTGTNHCDSSEAQTTPFTWSLINSESKLVILEDGEYDTTSIISLDATTFKGSTVMDGSQINGVPGTKYTLTVTATH